VGRLPVFLPFLVFHFKSDLNPYPEFFQVPRKIQTISHIHGKICVQIRAGSEPKFSIGQIRWTVAGVPAPLPTWCLRDQPGVAAPPLLRVV
jgi:hypothetical protein